MMRLLAWLVLAVVAACQSEQPALPDAPARRQADLARRILTGLEQLPKDDAGARADAALAVAEIAASGYSSQLRLLVAGDDAVVGRGAAVALVRIRLLRQPARVPTLTECVKTETNQWVREECSRQLAAGGPAVSAAPSTAEMVALLDSWQAETRRAALRRWLAARSPAGPLDATFTAKLVHLLNDDDLRVRLLTQAVFLRASLAAGL